MASPDFIEPHHLFWNSPYHHTHFPQPPSYPHFQHKFYSHLTISAPTTSTTTNTINSTKIPVQPLVLPTPPLPPSSLYPAPHFPHHHHQPLHTSQCTMPTIRSLLPALVLNPSTLPPCPAPSLSPPEFFSDFNCTICYRLLLFLLPSSQIAYLRQVGILQFRD